MDLNDILTILFRYLHVIMACMAIGAAVFMRFILPRAVAGLDEANRVAVLRICRRGMKMIIHPAILFLLVSGTYNAYRNWPKYHDGIPWTHAFFGMHVLLGLCVFTLQLMVLAGKEPKPGQMKMLGWAVGLVFVVVLMGSSLKWAQERNPVSPAPPKQGTVIAMDGIP